MSRLSYTPEQERAMRTRHVGVALDAGAGCGKTFVLTERYLSHLDPAWSAGELPAKLDEVVAITFTDAAAREMRDRIRSKCRQRMATAEASERTFWRNLLQSLDGARVSTIHSLCSQIVRQHAIPLGIDPSFRVMDANESHVLRHEELDATLQRLLLADGAPDEDLVQVAAAIGLGGLKQRLLTFCFADHQPKFEAWSNAEATDQIAAWQKVYRERVLSVALEKLLASKAFAEFEQLLPMATPSSDKATDHIGDLRDVLLSLRSRERTDEAIGKLRPLLNGKIQQNKDWPSKEEKLRFNATLKSMKEVLKKLRPAPVAEGIVLETAELGLRLQRLAIEARCDYTRAKLERGLVDQDDLLRYARRLLTEPAFEQERARLAAGIRILLVDEFQDTDRLQVDIVRALVGAVGEQRGGLEDGRLFFVGDFKQSIYRFRGAEPEVFLELRDSIPDEGRLPLSTNFRSQPAVLEFVNQLFCDAFGQEYLPLVAQRKQQTPTPAVEFLWTAKPPVPEGKNKVPVELCRRDEAVSIAARIRALLDGDEKLVVDKQTGEPRAARAGDIVLLFRALSDVRLYEEALRDAGVDYYIAGGHAFYTQQEIYDLVNLLRVIDSAANEIALLGALRSPLFGLDDASIFWLASQRGIARGLYDKFPQHLSEEQHATAEEARRIVDRLRQRKDHLSVTRLMEEAVALTGYDATLMAEHLGERKLANLEKLFVLAERSDQAGGDLRSFLRQLDEFIASPPKESPAATSSEASDVVRLMTVHYSKGLEFPIVFLPDLDRSPQSLRMQADYTPDLGPLLQHPDVSELAVDKKKEQPMAGLDLFKLLEAEAEAEEAKRLFYVACTRAADRLVLSASVAEPLIPKGAEDFKGPWLKLLATRFDLTTGERLSGEEDDPQPDELFAQVVPPEVAAPCEAKQQQRALGQGLGQAEQEWDAASKKPIQPSPLVAPVAPTAERTFSVSRLTGELYGFRPAKRPARSDQPTPQVDPAALGDLTHRVLERLPIDQDPRRTLEVARQWIDALAPRVVRRQADLAIEQITRMISRLVAAPIWNEIRQASDYQREVEFLLAWPPEPIGQGSATAMIRGYLDALRCDQQGDWHLIDYKTNRIATDQVKKTASQYQLQMGVYALAAERALGTPPRSLTLYFLEPGVAHTFVWDEAMRQATIKLVDQAIEAAQQPESIS